MIDYLLLVAIGYIMGSVPFGLIAGRLSRGVDVRDHGSGMTGSTNVLRTVGVRAGVAVLLLDMGKGVVAVALGKLISDASGVEVAAGLAALIGHNWPVFVGFRGGRGTAPGWGGLVMLSPVAGAIATVIGAGSVALWRYVSLGSILGATSGAMVLIFLALAGSEPPVYTLYGLIGTPLIIVRHSDNIGRLLGGRERKLGEKQGPARDRRPPRGLRWPRSA